MKRATLTLLLAAGLLATLGLTACDRTIPPPSPEEQQKILKDAPQIFDETDGKVSLDGLPGVYLGQPKDEALAAVKKLCPKPMEYRAGEMGDNAWFRGCVLKEARGPITSVRVGFWPRLGDRVATLEVKRGDATLDQIRERFRQFAGKLSVDLPHPGMVEMRGQKYQMMADKDDGKDAPAHIAFGYTQKWAKKLEGE